MASRSDGEKALPSANLAPYLSVALFAILTAGFGGVTWFCVTQKEVGERMVQRALLPGITVVSMMLTVRALVRFLRRRGQLNLNRESYESESAHPALAEHYDYLSRYANDVVLLLDAEGGIVRANDRAADVYGYTTHQLRGMNIRQLRAPSSQPGLGADWQLAKERGSLIFETVHQRRDGSELDVEVSTRSITVEGRTLQQSIIRDVSDRKHAERELSKSEARFRQCVENAPYGILVVEGHSILYANPEAVRMFGAGAQDDLVGHSLLERARPEEHEAMNRRYLEMASGMPRPVAERRYLRLNGEEFWVSVSAVAIDYNQRPAGLLFYRDITPKSVPRKSVRGWKSDWFKPKKWRASAGWREVWRTISTTTSR